MQNNKSIFVTGIAGFIGFHLAQKLAHLGFSVRGCDNFNAYYDPALKLRRAELLKEIGIEVISADINALEALEPSSIVIHLAAQAGVRYASQDPGSYVHSNLAGFVQVLEWVKRTPPKLFLYASSSSVYGLNRKRPFAESDRTDAPANLYGATKKANESIAHAYHHMTAIPMVGLRFFTVYGPWGRPDMAYYLFADAITKQKEITLYNEGLLRRDFTYVDDIVSGIVSCLNIDMGYHLFNLGSDRPLSTLTLVETLERLFNQKAHVVYKKAPEGEMDETWADLTLTREKLNFSPQISFEEGMTRFVKWHQEYSASMPLTLQNRPQMQNQTLS